MKDRGCSKSDRSCNTCEHLVTLNGREFYAECDCAPVVFESFGLDTRKTYCNRYEVKL